MQRRIYFSSSILCITLKLPLFLQLEMPNVMNISVAHIRRTLQESYSAQEAANLSRIVCCEILGQTAVDYYLGKDIILSPKAMQDLDGILARLHNFEPIQYIQGTARFLERSYHVAPGVLIPRPETEILAEFAFDFLKKKNDPIVFDLCSGSGCIAISVAKLCPNSTVYAVEKSDDAFNYLMKNIELNGVKNVKAVKGDVFDKMSLSGIAPDLILSNPPYIRSSDIAGLQSEVKKEPVTALDGGEDGYDFYRVIASDWIKQIKSGGAIAVECAEDQTEYISELFSKHASVVKAYNDLSGLPRGVIALI